MKNSILFLICLVAICETTFAQRLVKGGVHFSFAVPVHQKQFSSNFDVSKSLNFNIGVYVRIGEKYHGQTGIYYYINKLSLKNTAIDSTSKVELGQLNFPFLFVYGWRWGKKNMLRINAGIQYRVVVKISDNKIHFNKTSINRHNADGMIGLGVDIGNIALDASFYKALKPLAKEAGSRYYQDMVNLSIGVVF